MQNSLMASEKLIWVNDYEVDILETLLNAERRRKRIYFRSIQLREKRLDLLKFIRKAGYHFQLSQNTVYLAAYYLDRFLDKFSTQDEKLHLTACVCIRIAAQFEDADSTKPKYVNLNKLVGDFYGKIEFKVVEKAILHYFDYDMLRPTVQTFLNYFAKNFITQYDFEMFRALQLQNGVLEPQFTNFQQMVELLAICLQEIANITLNYYGFSNIKASLLAATCILVARYQLLYIPSWTRELQEFTQYSYHTLQPFAVIINTIILQKKHQSSNLEFNDDFDIPVLKSLHIKHFKRNYFQRPQYPNIFPPRAVNTMQPTSGNALQLASYNQVPKEGEQRSTAHINLNYETNDNAQNVQNALNVQAENNENANPECPYASKRQRIE